MATGKKTGGRQAGTPNRRTMEVQETLAQLDCDPIAGMAMIAMDENNSPELRGRMFAELAGYVAPKRKAVEYTEVWDGDLKKLTNSQLKVLAATLKESIERERALLADQRQLPEPGALVVTAASTEA